MRTRSSGKLASFLRRLRRKVWVRAALFTIIAVAFVLVARYVDLTMPLPVAVEVGQGAVDTILQIIATAMLTTTTFSITAMVTAFSSASSIATPRATQLLVADPTSQRALSTFLGAFAFSLVGIIALATGFYGDGGRTVLFLGTLIVIVIVVVTLLRWISHLADFGRLADVIDRVESAASTALCEHAASPALGAVAIDALPTRGRAIHPESPGIVGHVDVGDLQDAAEDAGVVLIVAGTAGQVVDASRPLVYVEGGAVDDGLATQVRRAFRVQSHREYDQDPRLGLIALAEIGSRALSPSTNDPGTAIEVVDALQRVLTRMLATEVDADVRYDRVRIRPVQVDELVQDAYRPLARDGAGFAEVQLRIQHSLAALATTSPDHAGVFRAAATDALRRARGSMDDADLRELRSTARDAWRAAR